MNPAILLLGGLAAVVMLSGGFSRKGKRKALPPSPPAPGPSPVPKPIPANVPFLIIAPDCSGFDMHPAWMHDVGADFAAEVASEIGISETRRLADEMVARLVDEAGLLCEGGNFPAMRDLSNIFEDVILSEFDDDVNPFMVDSFKEIKVQDVTNQSVFAHEFGIALGPTLDSRGMLMYASAGIGELVDANGDLIIEQGKTFAYETPDFLNPEYEFTTPEAAIQAAFDDLRIGRDEAIEAAGFRPIPQIPDLPPPPPPQSTPPPPPAASIPPRPTSNLPWILSGDRWVVDPAYVAAQQAAGRQAGAGAAAAAAAARQAAHQAALEAEAANDWAAQAVADAEAAAAEAARQDRMQPPPVSQSILEARERRRQQEEQEQRDRETRDARRRRQQRQEDRRHRRGIRQLIEGSPDIYDRPVTDLGSGAYF